ncbi:MAG: monovalent cation/H+ antiporter complex subunit F [Paludibacter sp.]|jgi:multicomponent Na+:H+ antiporter subunit F|nr:monovalent cation/H+ antiporter complex subunit F [Paludibacter sp.]
METSISEIILFIALGFLMLAMVFTLYRLLKGPTFNDQIAAMDLLASIIIGVIMVYGMLINNKMYFDIAIVIALVSFIGTIAISTFIKKKNG